MIEEIQVLVDKYHEWLKDRTPLREVDDWVEITTPYLDRHNDHLQIYVRKNDNGYVLTDDSYILNDLALSGFNLESRKRQALLQVTLNSFGIQKHGDALEVHATTDTFPMRKHNLVQAMLSINDLFNLASPQVESLFLEDVGNWLDAHDIRYTPRAIFHGKSGYEHHYDYVIPRSKRAPERIIKAANSPTKQTAEIAAFAWIDTKETRDPESQAYLFLNDSDKPVAGGVLEALRTYHIRPVMWSKREDYGAALAA